MLIKITLERLVYWCGRYNVQKWTPREIFLQSSAFLEQVQSTVEVEKTARIGVEQNVDGDVHSRVKYDR